MKTALGSISYVWEVRFATGCFQNNWGNSRSTSLWYGIVKVLHLKEISYILHHCGRVLNNRCYWTNLLITNDSRLQLELSSSYRPKYFYCKWRIFNQGRAIPGSPITLEYNPLTSGKLPLKVHRRPTYKYLGMYKSISYFHPGLNKRGQPFYIPWYIYQWSITIIPGGWGNRE